MNQDTMEGKWKQLVGAAKQRWAKLTDDDLTYLTGKKDELVGRLQERYGYSREQAHKEADDFARANSVTYDEANVHRAAASANAGRL